MKVPINKNTKRHLQGESHEKAVRAFRLRETQEMTAREIAPVIGHSLYWTRELIRRGEAMAQTGSMVALIPSTRAFATAARG